VGPDSGVLVLIALGVAALIAIVVAVARAQQKAAEARRLALSQIAQEHGLVFCPFGLEEPPRGFWEKLTTSFSDTNLGRFLERFEGFSPFGQGHSFGVANLLMGRRGQADWYAFDYLYHTTQSNGKSTRTVPHPTGIVAVRLPLSMPRLTLTPENLFHKIGTALGMDELDFELEEFNKRYFVRSDDRKLAYDLLHPRMIEHLMSQESRAWQIGGQYIVQSRAGYYSPEEVRASIAEIEGFVGLIPHYVEQDHGLPALHASPLD
jgi:hypothetical protein